MEVDRPASATELAALREFVRRVGNHEPVQYILGEWGFYGRAFKVSRETLIPRPSTETLVEHAVRHARTIPKSKPIRIVDIGTGTGCVAVTLAIEIPVAQIVATDITEDILELARENAQRHGVADRIQFRQGNLEQPLRESEKASFDLFCSNPPYISDAEWNEVPPNVKNYEPATALRGGEDGLAFVRPLIERAGDWLRPGGRVFIEIAHSQRDAAMAIIDRAERLGNGEVLQDSEKLWRVATAIHR